MSRCDVCHEPLKIEDTCLGAHPGWIHKKCCREGHNDPKRPSR